MTEIEWDTITIEPERRPGSGGQVSVCVRGADGSWAQRFNELAEGQFRRGEVRGGRWGLIRFDEVEAVITVDDFYGDNVGALRHNIEGLARQAAG